MGILRLPFELRSLVNDNLDCYTSYCLRLALSNAETRQLETTEAENLFLNAMKVDHAEVVESIVKTYHISTTYLQRGASEASASGNIAAVTALLGLVHNIGYSDALREAVKHDREDLVNAFLQWATNHGKTGWARLQLPFHDAKTPKMRTLLCQHDAVKSLEPMVRGGHIEEVEKILRTGNVPKDPRMLDIAMSFGNNEMVLILRVYGYHSQRAYVRAIREGKFDLADSLGGDPNAISCGKRPLHEVASSAAGIEYLLNRGADQTMLDDQLQNPMQITVAQENELAILALNWGCHRYPLRERHAYANRGYGIEGKRRRI